MKCPKCQYDNREDAKFCKSCGFKLADLQQQSAPEPEASPAALTCPSCGNILKPGAKFCSKCGSAVTAAAPEPVPEPIPAEKPKRGRKPKAPAPVETETVPETVPAPETVSATEFVPVPEPIPETIPAPEPISVNEPAPEPISVNEPAPEPEPGPAFCKKCGSPLKPGARFCPKCGHEIGKETPPIPPQPPVIPSGDHSVKGKDNREDNYPEPSKPKKKKKTPVIILWILIILLLLAGGAFALSKTGIIDLPFLNGETQTTPQETDPENNEAETTEETTDTEETAEADEDISAELEEKLAPIAEQVSAAESKLSSEDYSDASTELYEALTAYADLASTYDTQAAIDTISPPADNAFSLYTTAILKQVEGWEGQSVTAPLYQQIDATLAGAVELASQLKEGNLNIDTDDLDQNYAGFPDRYKEKYILTFNDLRTGDEWSRTTAWNYMQDAASIGLVNKDDPDDPLTLRYAYALAWITQRDLSESMNNGSLTAETAAASILPLAEGADYNPILMRELALYYEAAGDSTSSAIIQDACVEVYHYLANNENIYINAEDLFVPGRSSSNASSTIALNDFWYFNDFGEYAPSNNNGVTPEGREYIRTLFKEAIDSLEKS